MSLVTSAVAKVLGADSTTVPAAMKALKAQAWPNGWKTDAVVAGDFMGKQKNNVLIFELEKKLDGGKVSEALKDADPHMLERAKFSNGHMFVIQGQWSRDGKKPASLTIYLRQAGQLVTFGAVAPKKLSKDASFKELVQATIAACNLTDKDLVLPLFDSGYDRYGRS